MQERCILLKRTGAQPWKNVAENRKIHTYTRTVVPVVINWDVFSQSVGSYSSYTDKHLLHYTADRAVIQTGKSRLAYPDCPGGDSNLSLMYQ